MAPTPATCYELAFLCVRIYFNAFLHLFEPSLVRAKQYMNVWSVHKAVAGHGTCIHSLVV